MTPRNSKYRRLDPQRIVQTVQALHARIEGRFPGCGLGNVVTELRRVAGETLSRTQWIQKPHLPLRICAILLCAAIVALLAGLLVQGRHFRLDEYPNSVQTLEASISSMVFIGAAVIFLVSWEHRIKRNRSLDAIHALCALAPIVDMHQLTKDSESYLRPNQHSISPPRRAMTPFELNCYLDYCIESLALICKNAALYVQEFQDAVLLEVVHDVERLTSGFASKTGQKINLLETLSRTLPEPVAAATAAAEPGAITSAS